MPKYEFDCVCGLQFERTLKMGEHPMHVCPICGEAANRVWAGGSFGFGFAEGNSSPANSGVTKHDYPTADYAVGASSDQRWSEYRARDQVKRQVREKGSHRTLIRQNGKDYIEYKSGSDGLVETRKKLVKEVNQVLKKT